MKYLKSKFTVAVGSQNYRGNYDRVFGPGNEPELAEARADTVPGVYWWHVVCWCLWVDAVVWDTVRASKLFGDVVVEFEPEGDR